MRTVEDMLFSIERQRAGRAVDGKLPAILEVDANVAEDGSVLVLVELFEGGCIASGFDLESIVEPTEAAEIVALRAMLKGIRETRAAFAAEAEASALAEVARLFNEAEPVF
jgi:hypothetical protein